jgi:hypothetical protein
MPLMLANIARPASVRIAMSWARECPAMNMIPTTAITNPGER